MGHTERLRGGNLGYASIEADGETLMLGLTEQMETAACVSWALDIDAETSAGRVRVGHIDTVPAFLGGVATRMVGVAHCAGVRRWAVSAQNQPLEAPGTVTADLLLAPGRGCVLADALARQSVQPIRRVLPVDPAAGVPLIDQAFLASRSAFLARVFGSNEGAAARWLMIFNQSGVPANGTEPRYAIAVPAGQSFSLSLAEPRFFHNGIVWMVSSTAGSLTLDAAATFRVNAEIEV